MALAKLVIRCADCGCEFEHRHACANSTEKDSYMIWAREHITRCYNCSVARKAKESGLEEVRMPYAEYKNKYSDCKTKADSYDKSTKTIIVYIKSEKRDV